MRTFIEKILIVEDDSHIQQLYNRVFAEMGYNVIIAKDGQEGISKLEQCNPSLVILDIELPKINGFGVLSYMRKNNNNTSVFVISGLPGIENHKDIHLTDQVKFVSKKPVNVLDLINKVPKIININSCNVIPEMA